jgi:hypothetical protein
LDRYDEDYSDNSETNKLLTSAKIDNPGGGFGSDEKVTGASDNPSNRSNKYTKQIYSLLDGDGRAVHMVDFDKWSCHPGDYQVMVEPQRVFVLWREPYFGFRKVSELPIENGASDEMQRIFKHEPFRSYIKNVCIKRTHHILYFKVYGRRLYGLEELLCLAWSKTDKVLRPSAAFNYYRTVIKNFFADAARDAGRKIRAAEAYSDLVAGPREVVLQKAPKLSRGGDSSWTGT